MVLRNPILFAIKRARLSQLATVQSTIASASAPARFGVSQKPLRCAHTRRSPPPPPPPTPFVPDVPTFLTLIGRSLSQHASKFPSWAALFTTTSTQLKELGIEPARARRYLLRWRNKFRYGEWGVGGDLAHVEDGVGLVGVVELPRDLSNVPQDQKTSEGEGGETAINTRGAASLTKSSGVRRIVVSLPLDTESPPSPDALHSLKRIKDMKVKSAGQISGPYAELVKGSGGRLAKIRVQEGLWEHKRGVKLDGGERRRADVRAKRRAAERKAAA